MKAIKPNKTDLLKDWLAVATLALYCSAATALQAATLTVTSIADSGPGSLRAALKSARSGDTIKFSLPSPATIRLTTGELLVSKNLSILGPGAGYLSVSGNSSSRVFHISSGATVTIAGLAVINGFATAKYPANMGGGIYNDHANLSVSNCVFSGNVASESGGAIANFAGGSRLGAPSATLTVVNCMLSGNSAVCSGCGSSGGAISSDGSGSGATVTILNSTLAGNWVSDGDGGGIVNFPGSTMTLKNCTVSGNYTLHGGFGGGGIFNGAGTLTVLNSTFSGNSANTLRGNGIFNVNKPLTLGSTVLNNSVPGDPTGDIFSNVRVISLGFNLSSDSGDAALTQPTDQVNTDPLLGPLQDNGGPTFTHAPLPGSPAIDQGENFSGSDTDQREAGFFRTVDYSALQNALGGDGTDIGAVEIQ